jgi:hypothetical protein
MTLQAFDLSGNQTEPSVHALRQFSHENRTQG